MEQLLTLHARIQKGGPALTIFFIFLCVLVAGERGSKYRYKRAIIVPQANSHYKLAWQLCDLSGDPD